MGGHHGRAARSAGFSLVELMTVVAIIGIMASIAIPTFQGYKKRVYLTEAYTTLSALYRGEAAYWDQSHVSSKSVNALDKTHCTISCVAGFMPPPGGVPTARNPGVHGPGCGQLGLEHDAPTRMAYLTCPGPGCAQGCYADAETDQAVYNNVLWWDFDADGKYPFMYEHVRTRDGSLYRAAHFVQGDSDDAP